MANVPIKVYGRPTKPKVPDTIIKQLATQKDNPTSAGYGGPATPTIMDSPQFTGQIKDISYEEAKKQGAAVRAKEAGKELPPETPPPKYSQAEIKAKFAKAHAEVDPYGIEKARKRYEHFVAIKKKVGVEGMSDKDYDDYISAKNALEDAEAPAKVIKEVNAYADQSFNRPIKTIMEDFKKGTQEPVSTQEQEAHNAELRKRMQANPSVPAEMILKELQQEIKEKKAKRGIASKSKKK